MKSVFEINELHLKFVYKLKGCSSEYVLMEPYPIVIIKAMNFTYLHILSGSLYLSKSLGADESHNKGSFSELLLYI
jgi:hypothetical protein